MGEPYALKDRVRFLFAYEGNEPRSKYSART